jgi:hypothetical protein
LMAFIKEFGDQKWPLWPDVQDVQW